MNAKEKLCRELEHYETPKWAARSILEVEPFIGVVVDPCTGTGVLADAAKRKSPWPIVCGDIHDWGYKGTCIQNFLKWTLPRQLPHYEFTVFMNPPFSKACEFVEHALLLGAAKVICFQRFAWYESADRKDFFSFYPPDRIWLCGNRATSWRHDISPLARRIHPETGKKRSGSSTAHAWFVWQRNSKNRATTIDRIWRAEGEKDE